MEHVAAAVTVTRPGARLGELVAVVRVRRHLRELAAAVVHVAVDVDRAGGDRRGGDARRRVVHVVTPHPNVGVAAFHLDGVIPGALHAVAVHVAVGAGPALRAVIVAAADGVHVVVLLVGAPHLVVADDVVAAALVRRDGVRAGRVAPVPAVRAVARVVDFVALDDVAVHIAHVVVATRGDARVLIDAELPAAAVGGLVATPAADVVVLDDDVVLARLHDDAVLLRTLDGEAAHDDVVGLDADAGRLRVRHVDDRAGGCLVEHVAVGRSALGYVERGRLAADRDGLRDRELFAPRRRSGLHRVRRARADLHVVGRGRCQVDQAAAALVVAAVVPEVEALTPGALTLL